MTMKPMHTIMCPDLEAAFKAARVELDKGERVKLSRVSGGEYRLDVGDYLPLRMPQSQIRYNFASLDSDDTRIRDAEGTLHTADDLQVFFKKVKNPEDWKLPINATIDAADVAPCTAAIEYFAGGCVEDAEVYGTGKVRLMAPGYYKAIGS